MTEFRPARLCARAVFIMTGVLCAPPGAQADAGPPFLTNDPGTPGNGTFEINLASMATIERGLATYQLPQMDVNYGVGERLQLTCLIPYVLQMRDGAPTATGWGNAYAGLKWRFLDQGEDGWQLSTFPQLETEGSQHARDTGIAVDGPRLLLPVEVAHKAGELRLNFEAGYYPSWHGQPERILGLVAGRNFTPRLDLDMELYNDHVLGTTPNVVTLDVGGRYRLQRGVILLFMTGRSVTGNGAGQVQFMGFIGVQLLLGDYGRRLGDGP